MVEYPWPVPTRWDRRSFARAAVAAGLAFGLALLLTAATDEGGVPWGERVARTLALCPGCAAIGVWAALGPARARGETVALAALGRSTAQVTGAAVAGGAGLALLAALAVGGSVVSVAAFYPRAGGAEVWTWEGRAFVDRGRGLEVGRDGTPWAVARTPGVEMTPVVPPYGRLAAALSVALAGTAFAMLVAHALLTPRRNPARVVSGGWLGRGGWEVVLGASGACVAASLVLFQAAAARLVPAIWGAAPAMGLLALAAWRYRAVP
jgi:hypothetical protein